ncbi:hypothetical protein EXN66_Car011069 [Channa argus]|uniref:Uncharacterized protein n=1 Tax=Channa argus TaxID=215402 RepID=A0A6G1PYY6_CHAAH|nr:hypothetical protein EXN66_Car011069 [Channa argus]
MAESQTIKFPIPALPETAYTAKKGKRRKTLAEKEERRKETDKARFKSRIYIGMAFPRWRELREEKNFQTDTDLALYLLDCYDDRSVISAPSKYGYKPPGLPPLSTIEAESISDRDEDILSDAEELDDVQIQQVETSDSMNVCSVEVDIDEYNDIRNTVIDWNHDALDPTNAHECSSHEESSTPLCVRTGGDVSPQMCLDSLPEISLEETVHGLIQPEETGPTGIDPFIPDKLEILCEDDIVGHQAAIVYHDSLKQLATHLILPVNTCRAKDPSTQVCPNGHTVWKWSSQPLMKCEMQIGDFMLAANILLSGNNYRKVALLLRNMNMGMVDQNLFSQIQDSYCVETIKAFWEEKRRDNIDKLCDKNSVVLGDCRLSSPGQGATYCTCTAMDNDSKEILSIVNMDNVRTQQNSTIMEKEAFIQTIDKLKQEIKIQESLWIGILHHVTDEHEWATGACHHGPLPRNQHSIWIEEDSVAHAALISVIMNQTWLRDVEKFLPFRYRKVWNRKSKRWRLYTIKVPKDYSYIPDLQSAILRRWLTDEKGMQRKRGTHSSHLGASC